MTALFRAIAERAPGTVIVLTGGEPLLRDDIFELVSAGSVAGLRVVLGTNGRLINHEVAARLKEAGLQGVGVSLDSPSPQEHDSFRGIEGAWKRAIAAIEACRDVDLHVQMHTTVMRHNVEQIPSVVRLAREHGVAIVNFFFLICTGRGERLSDIEPEEYETALHKIAQLQMETPSPMIQARCAPHFKRILHQLDPASPFTRAQGYDGGGCLAGSHYCRIDPVGNVTPCPYLENVAGNIRQTPFWEIWDRSPLFAALRAPRLTGRCESCEYRALCGGCRARAQARHGSLMAEDPSCSWKPKGRPEAQVPAGPAPTYLEARWTPAARKRLERVPPFVRDMVRKRLEEKAVKEGRTITPEFMAEYRGQREKELGLKFTDIKGFETQRAVLK